MGGVETVAAAVRADLAERLPSQNKKQREGLALLVATALDVRSVNLMELAAAVPRTAERLDMRYQWISRLLGNACIDVEAVMAPYAREVLARACVGSRTLVVIIDQSKVNDAHHMVMVSLRVFFTRPASRVAREEDARRDRLSRAARGLGDGRRPAARGRAPHADGRSFLWLARVDRLVSRSRLGLAAALQAGPARVRQRRRDGSVRARANLKSGYHLLWLLTVKHHTILCRSRANRAVWRES